MFVEVVLLDDADDAVDMFVEVEVRRSELGTPWIRESGDRRRDGHNSWNESKEMGEGMVISVTKNSKEMRETMVIGAGKTTRRWEKGCHSSWNDSKMGEGMAIAAGMIVRWEKGWS